MPQPRGVCPHRPAGNTLEASAIFSWHEKEFVAAYAEGGAALRHPQPDRRAILAFVQPKLLQTERDFLEKTRSGLPTGRSTGRSTT